MNVLIVILLIERLQGSLVLMQGADQSVDSYGSGEDAAFDHLNGTSIATTSSHAGPDRWQPYLTRTPLNDLS